MKKKLVNLVISVSILLVMALCFAPATMATTITAGDWVTLIAHNNLSSAGIMTYAVSNSQNGPTVGSYDTFCIQKNTYIWYGETFLVEDVSDTVGKYGNQVANTPGAGALVGEVDYLFSLFAAGNYDADFYNSGSNLVNKSNQADFQQTLWSLQGSGPAFTSVGTSWAVDLASYVANGSYGTKVLNIIDSKGNVVQNQLWHNSAVPEPATMLLLGFGLVGLAGMRRKFRI
jgi:hypothetical protein